MTQTALHRHGFVVTCDAERRVQRSLRRDVSGPDALSPGRLAACPAFPDLVEPASADKAQRLFAEVDACGVAFDWELNIAVGGRPTLFYVQAAALEDTVLLVGADRRHQAAGLFTEAMRSVRGPLGRLLQAVARDRQTLVSRDASGEELAFLDQFTTLQNELARMQRDLFKKNVELERLAEQRNYVVGMAAHELRNPLCSIRFYSDYLVNETLDLPPDKQARFLRIIRESSGFMARLIDDLLSVSHLDSGRLQLDRHDVDLADLIGRTVALNALIAESKDITLHMEVPEEPVIAAVDATKLDQVLSNLVTNAIKFSSGGAAVTLTLRRTEAEAEITVRDEGPGIPAAELAGLFEPFRMTSVKATAGERSTGLGLYIARRIVEGHGGALFVESEEGAGSSFRIRLPTG